MEVSIIIPVYNAEKTIRKCVESIIYGLVQDIEIILINDASTDNSWTVCEALQTEFKQVICYCNQENKGVSYSRNQGLKIARGKYILFVDSDDWVSGKYVNHMLSTIEKYYNSMVICGYTYIEEISGNKIEYIYRKNVENISFVSKEFFFELCQKVYLQQLWNKIFRRDIIEKNHIYFDESQSMGEDFEFVLDYIEAAKCNKCIILNESLYYYVRANSKSLMSNFGLVQSDTEYSRYTRLFHICGGDKAGLREQYDRAILATKKNYIYQVSRDKKRSRSEKTAFIENIMQDGKAKQYYVQQRQLMAKENIVKMVTNCKRFLRRVKDKIHREKIATKIKNVRSKLKNYEFTLISQNCIGGIFYHDMEMQFTSPTINLYLKCDDFVRFVLNLKYYLNLKLEISWGEEYPIGRLGDITIFFMHYDTCTEAKKAWEVRKNRVNYENVVVLCTDMEEFTVEVFNEWKKISYPKVLFTAKEEFSEEKGSVYYPDYSSKGKVVDLIPKREFYKDDILINAINREW